MGKEVDFSKYDLMNPDELQSDEAWKSWVCQSIGRVLERQEEFKETQKQQGKDINCHNRELSDVEEKVEELESVQKGCMFKHLDSWIGMTSAGFLAIAAAATGVYGIIRLVAFLMSGGTT